MQKKTVSAVAVEVDNAYADFERLVAGRVAALKAPLFTTNAEGLFAAYLAGIPAGSHQHYTCHSCRRFLETYGSLATIDDTGHLHSALWAMAGVPEFFRESAGEMQVKVLRAKVTGVFINGNRTWGHPNTGAWTHISGIPPKELYHASPLKNAFQLSAEKGQDYITLHRGLAEIPLEAVVQAVRVLEADAVDRSEKTLGVAQWLLALHRAIADLRGPLRDNLIWLAVAKAPPGWCHIRSTMIATLLDDVVQGLPFESIKSRWNAKMHPLQYQRPTTVRDGNIEQANKIVAKLGSEGALLRRFARLEEVMAIWKPGAIEPAAEKQGGVFDHLKKVAQKIIPVELPATRITWDKFRDTILPIALTIEVHIPTGPQGFYGLVTAVNPETPPLLQWDGLEGFPRNPVSWYFYHGGSTPEYWGLVPGWIKVDAICLKPCYWQRPESFAHQGKGIYFVLSGARDTRHVQGAGFFPECLRSEYHEIRSAMEAYAQKAAIAGRDEGTANGIALGEKMPLTVRVKTRAATDDYVVSLES